MAERCENCGKLITFSNIGLMSTMFGLCNDCNGSMGILDKAIYFHDRGKRKDKERADQYAIERQERDELIQERRDRRGREPTFRSILVWDSEEDRLEHVRLSREDRAVCVKKEKALIHLAILDGIQPHNFNYDNYCMLCGKHVEDIPESRPGCVPKKKRNN